MKKTIGILIAAMVFAGILYSVSAQVVPGRLPVVSEHAFVVAHISSVSHVVLAGTSAGSIPISTIAHVASVVHVGVSGLGTPTQALSVRCVNTGATAFVDCGGAGGSGDAVNVFHQSTVAHISAVTHISAAGTPWNFNMALATRCVNTGATAFESCGGTVTSDTVNVFHQSTIRHISSVTHIAGVVQPSNIVNTTPWLVNVAHISTVVHVSIHGFGFHNTNVVEPSTQAFRVTNVTHVTIMGTISHNSGQLHITAFHSSGALRAWTVSTCGTTASLAVATNRARRDLILQNIGTRPIFIGYGTTGHVALATTNGFMLHAGEGTGGSAAQMPSALGRLELRDYNGPIACISTDAGQTMNVLEILKN